MAEGRCSVRMTRRYADAPAEVWKALTEPRSLDRWLRPGFELRQSEVEPGRVLELDWRPPGEEPSLVRIELGSDREARSSSSTTRASRRGSAWPRRDSGRWCWTGCR